MDNEKTCQKCGAITNKDSMFCDDCFYKTTNSTYIHKKSFWDRWNLIIYYIIAIVIAVIIGSYLVFSQIIVPVNH